MPTHEFEGYQVDFDYESFSDEVEEGGEAVRVGAAITFPPGQDLSGLGLTSEALSGGYLSDAQVPADVLEFLARFLNAQKLPSAGVEEQTDVDRFRTVIPPFTIDWDPDQLGDNVELEVYDDGTVWLAAGQSAVG